MSESEVSDEPSSPLSLLGRQRSHMLFVLSDAQKGYEAEFLEWYRGIYQEAVLQIPGVLSLGHYEQHSVDITGGHYPRLPLRYLGTCELALDGAFAAECIIDLIALLHDEHRAAQAPATWLYYAASEKVGRPTKTRTSMLTLAFANAVTGQEAEFREWYATRHIRHALHVPALVSGQCFERTLFQKPGSLEASFSTIAIYEQEGTPQSMLDSFATLPESTFNFPMLDLSRFSESVYQAI